MGKRSPPPSSLSDQGQSMVENGLIVALICMIVFGLILALGPSLMELLT